MTGRNEALLAGLATEELLGVEIGPLDRPIITPSMGRVLYVDHVDTETLRAKYADDPGVRVERLAPIDHVWDEDGLDRLARRHGAVDYIIASHVAEHVPDLLGWLAALARALSARGEIRLVVPDKRFCFDHHRALSTLADLLAAQVAGPRTPPLARIADYFLHVVEVDAAAVWAGRPPPPPVVDAGRYAWAASVCGEVHESGRYQDVHCWVFTPSSMCLLFADLAWFGVLALECTLFRDTERDGLEFLLGLRPCRNPAQAAASWRDAAACAMSAPDAAPAALRAPESRHWLGRSRARRR